MIEITIHRDEQPQPSVEPFDYEKYKLIQERDRRVYEMKRIRMFETKEILRENRDAVLNFPRYIREALYVYTRDNKISERDLKAINDGFKAIPPIDSPITLYRGIKATRETINPIINEFISSSISLDVARQFADACCLFEIRVPAGSKVIYIPKDIHYYDDEEDEVLLQGGGVLRLVSEEDGLFLVDYEVPVDTTFSSRIVNIKLTMDAIGQLNQFAIALGAEKGIVISDDDVSSFYGYLKKNPVTAEKFFKILIDELTPYPFEIELRPFATASVFEMALEGAPRVRVWDIPKGVPFARISIMLLYIILAAYPELAPPETRDESNFRALKLFCDHIKVGSTFVFDRLGNFEINSYSYLVAMQFDFEFPLHTDSEYVFLYINLLLKDTTAETMERRKEIIKKISYVFSLNMPMRQKIRKFLGIALV